MIVGLAEQGNMAVVARAFGVTQAAVSAGLKDLEARIGASLFSRSSRGLVATDAGELIIPHFRRCLSELRHIETDLAALDGSVQGTVRIGALPLGRTQILPDCIAAIVARYPRLRVATFESPYVQLVSQLRNGEIDFVFGALRQAQEVVDLDQTTLFDDRLAVIARSDHPLATAPNLSSNLALRDLLDAKWVMWRPESPSRQILRRCFLEAGLTPPQPAVETGDLAILRGLLLRSEMVAAASVDQLRYEIDRGDLVALPVDLGATRRSIGVATYRGSLPSAGARAMIEEIRFQVSRLIAEGALLPSCDRKSDGAHSGEQGSFAGPQENGQESWCARLDNHARPPQAIQASCISP